MLLLTVGACSLFVLITQQLTTTLYIAGWHCSRDTGKHNSSMQGQHCHAVHTQNSTQFRCERANLFDSCDVFFKYLLKRQYFISEL